MYDHCSICGKSCRGTAFKGGCVCKSCLQFIREIRSPEPAASASVQEAAVQKTLEQSSVKFEIS